MSPMEFLTMTYDEKIALMISDPGKLDLPDKASMVAQYLSQWRPLNPPAYSPENQSSADIKESLSSVVTLEINFVSRIMNMLGYALYVSGIGTPVWSMQFAEEE